MSARKRKLIENKRKQRAVVAEHKRNVQDHKIKIKTSVVPHMRTTRQACYINSKKNMLSIRKKWADQRAEARMKMKTQNRCHREKINAHKRRIKILMVS